MTREEAIKEAYGIPVTKAQYEALQILIPELAESEDERIRKEIIFLLKHYNSEEELTTKYPIESMIAYLEKHKEQKSGICAKTEVEYADKYSHDVWEKLMSKFKDIEGYRIGCNDVSDIVLNAILDAFKWKKDQENKPQPVELSENERIRKNCIHFLKLQKAHHADTSEIDDCIAYLERHIEQKPIQYDIDVLKKHITKDSVSELAHTVIVRNGWEIVEKEQMPAEWSEEDEEVYYLLDCILNDFTNAFKESAAGYKRACADADKVYSWVHNRLEPISPKPHEELDEEEVDFFIEDVKFPFKAKEKSTGKIVTITSGTENDDGASYNFFWSGKNRYLPEDLLKIK